MKPSTLNLAVGGMLLVFGGMAAGRLRENWDGQIGSFIELAVAIVLLASGVLSLARVGRTAAKATGEASA